MFPAYKVLCVFLRQISKPFANYLKKRASASDRFRNLCISFGNKSYAFDRYISRRFYNSEVNESEPINISQERSVIIGTELLGECVIFAIAAVLITAEYARSVRKEARKELQLKQRLDKIEERHNSILKHIDEEIDKRLTNKQKIIMSNLKRIISINNTFTIPPSLRKSFYIKGANLTFAQSYKEITLSNKTKVYVINDDK